jgi:hypothetical protein
MKHLPWCILLVTCAFAQKPGANENMIRDRGQTRPADQTQTLDRGRLGHQDVMPPGPLTLTGILVDASCRDRSSQNLGNPPRALEPFSPAPEAAVSAKGITVDLKTLQDERSGIMEHQEADLVGRQPDPTCAITGNTHAFALLMDNGRLLDLGEGGNTLASVAIHSSAAGRALLAGSGGGLKPRVTIEGSIRGDRLLVDKLNPF